MERINNIDDREFEPDHVTVTADDRSWMEGALGCEWPDEADEAEWLEHVNELVARGSIDMVRMTREERLEQRASVIEARHSFMRMFNLIPYDTEIKAREHQSTSTELSIAPGVIIGAQRFLREQGIDGLKYISQRAGNATRSDRALAGWVDRVASFGLDGVSILNTMPSLISLAPESIGERLQPLIAAARLAGMDDYRQAAIEFAQYYPGALASKPGRIRVLARLMTEEGVVPDDWSRLRSLLICPVQTAVVAHIEHADIIRSLEGLLHHTSQNRGRDYKELLGIIAAQAGRGDPVIKEYLKHYPIDDIEATKEVYVRHIRARDRRKEKPLLWQGPALLGNPHDTTSIGAYTRVIESPQLTDTQFNELAGNIMAGKQADLELRRLEIRHDDAEIATKTQEIERGVAAQRALIARHLGLAVDLARSCKGPEERAELVAVGNAALTAFVMENYELQEGPDEPMRFRHLAVLAIMRALSGEGPSYASLKLPELEKRWQVSSSETGIAIARPVLHVAWSWPQRRDNVDGVRVGLVKPGSEGRVGEVAIAGSDTLNPHGQVVTMPKEQFADFLSFIKSSGANKLLNDLRSA